MNGVISQRRIAEELGLSRMAVSLALRDSARVSEETRRRVREAAERLGYRQDPWLGALNRYRVGGSAAGYRETLAFVTKWREPEGWREQYVQRFFLGAKAAAVAAGYGLDAFSLGKYRSAARASAVLAARGIRGLVLAPMEQPGAIALEWERFATVAVGPTVLEPAVDRVLHDYEGSMRLTLAELERRGYRRPALVLPPRVDRITERRMANAFVGETRRNPAWRKALTCFSADESEAGFVSWVERHRPDCVISLVSDHADWLRSAGWRLREDIGCVNLHLKRMNGGWTGIDYGAEEIGATALDRLDSLLQRNALGLPARPVLMLLPGRWVEGAWVRAPTAG